MPDIIFRIDPDHPAQGRRPETADQARQLMVDGNRRFSQILQRDERAETPIIAIDPAAFGFPTSDQSMPDQRPFAVVLGCADARVPTEMIFDCWSNELFVVRVAGNILDTVVMASVDFAIKNLGESLRLVVVLGHRSCGAVSAAADAFLDPVRYLHVAPNHQVRSLVDRMFPAVRGADAFLNSAWGAGAGQKPGYRRALIETAVANNAMLTAWSLSAEFAAHLSPQLQVVCGLYNLATRQVIFPAGDEDGTSRTDVRLISPPASPEQYQALGMAMAHSPYIEQMLCQ